MPTSISEAADYDPAAVAAVYADGGIIQQGKERIGGTWAFCFVDAGGNRIFEAAGAVMPDDLGLPYVGNNTAEYLALLIALEHLPAGWSGDVFTDSGNTIGRFRDGWREKTGIPDFIARRKVDALARLGRLRYTLLGGHPTRADLERGHRPDGKPCSVHNVWCDKAATEAGKQYVKFVGAA